jgi:non-canonical purine NTP pyrophosphatase (RdgB/HAM1 family)
MSTLVLATHNAGKLAEFRTLLTPLGFDIKSAGELGLPEPEETGTTFEENAALKARAAAEASGLPALADDSGLVIPVLGGNPGIYSARWALNKDFNIAFERIQKELEITSASQNSSTYFMCVLCLYSPPLEGGVGGGVVATRHYPTDHSLFAKELRISSTEVEKRLWYRLRNRQIANAKFRRQQPIGNYIADFVCQEHKLIVELDGGQHNEESAQAADKIRDSFFASKGYQVLRFWNHDVIQNTEGVLEVILAALESPLLTRERARVRGSNHSEDLPLTRFSKPAPSAQTKKILPLPQGERESQPPHAINSPPLEGGVGGGVVKYFTGRVDGSLTFPPRGEKGFGYDPIFMPEGYRQTFAELPAEIKNTLSHRARAMEQLAAFLNVPHFPKIQPNHLD